MISKPKYGAPCNGCGYCCQTQACYLSTEYLKSDVVPCIALEHDNGRFWCGFVRDPAKYLDLPKTPLVGMLSSTLAYALRIDAGCDSDD